MRKLRHFLSQLEYIPATLRLVWAAARGWTAVWMTLLVLQGLLPAATVYLTGWLVDAFAGAVGNGLAWDNIQPVLVPTVLMGIALLLGQVFNGVMTWVRTAQSEIVQDYLSKLIHNKAIELDLSFYETPEHQDRLFQAHRDLKGRPLALLESGGSTIQNTITLLSVGALLIPYGLWLPLILLLASLPAVFVLLRFNRIYHQWWEQTTTTRRWADYFDNIMLLDTAAAEIKLFELGPHYRDSFQNIRQQLRGESISLARRQGLARFTATLSAIAATGGVMGWMIFRALLGQVTLGDIALFYQAINRGQGVLNRLLSSASQVYSNTLFLSNLFALLDLRPDVADPDQPQKPPAALSEAISFENVTFHYPGTQRRVLENFNFSVPAGKITAVVGSNGAGKTTMVKLICRFYDPQVGSIRFDGQDIRLYSVADLRRMLTVMFQFPIPFISTVGENIQMGDLTRPPTEQEFDQVARLAGSHDFITRLPKKYDTLLGKYFAEGTQLSGGQWQRLALTRSFWRNAPIMILDEPTSAMDSWSEIDWFDRFRSLAQGRTALLITHRFTTAKQADMIHVMEEGQIVESGTHKSLLALNGRYAESWRNQIQERESNPESQGDPTLTPGD